MGRFAPQPVANARSQPSGPTRPLFGGVGGNAHRVQAGQAAARVEARDAGPAGIHHHADALDGQAGFGDGRRQHDFAPTHRVRVQGALLIAPRQVAVQGQKRQPGASRFSFQPAQGLPDFRAAGEKHQQVAGMAVEGGDDGANHAIEIQSGGIARQIMSGDGIGATFADDEGRIPQQPGDRRSVQRRRHHQQPQILAQAALAVQSQRQRQIGMQSAFVEFVEDHQAHTVQRRIALQATGQNAFG